MTMITRTNNQSRPLLVWEDLTPKEQAGLDYIKPDETGAQFFRYKGCVYDSCDIPRASADLAPWDGCLAESYFSAILVRYTDDLEGVIVGQAFS